MATKLKKRSNPRRHVARKGSSVVRPRMSAEDREDIRDANKALRDMKKKGGFVTYDARQIVNW